MALTDNEIIKALECCSSDDANCDDCPANKYCTNDDFCLTGAILDLVNRQKAEIERLEKLYELAVAERDANVKGFTEELNAIKSKAIKEFAEELCEGRVSNDPVVIAVRCAVKEMTEGKDAGKDI